MAGLLKFLTCGSVDDGKSTLIGHLLYDSKLIYTDQEQTLELESKAGSRGGKLDYALLLDGLLAEHEQGITIDVAYRYFTTERRSFIVADTPGHEEYTRNMAVGASFADLAVILIDATKGVLPQTRRHARICRLLGIKEYIFAVNKMDMIQYSEQRFQDIEDQIAELVAQLQLPHTYTIPLSATEGDNITTKSVHTPWYPGEALLHILETIEVEDDALTKGFYMPVQRVSRPDHTFRGFQGQAGAGSVRIGDTLTVLPSGEQGKVKSIHSAGTSVQEACKGQALTLELDRDIDVSRGCIFVKGVEPVTTKSIVGDILWMDDEPLQLNHEYILHLATASTIAVVSSINYKTEVNTGEHVSAAALHKNELANCTLTLSNKLPAGLFDEYEALGSFILINRMSNMTAACGVVRELPNNSQPTYCFVEGDIKIQAPIFTEYLYDLATNTIKQATVAVPTFHIGDTLPLIGKTYAYPQNFDILAADSQAVVVVRNGRVQDIRKMEDGTFSSSLDIPLMDSHGFALMKQIDEPIELVKLASSTHLAFHQWHTVGFE